MKNKLLAMTWLLLAGCAAPAALPGAGESATAESRAVADTVQAFEAALRAGDFDTVSSLLDPHVLVLEAGGAERSREDYLALHAKADAEFLKDARSEESRPAIDVDGDLAWSTRTSQIHVELDGEPVIVDSAETMVLRRGADGWKIVHIHWSSRAREPEESH
jgi:ketosteroid isomerase-like protein